MRSLHTLKLVGLEEKVESLIRKRQKHFIESVTKNVEAMPQAEKVNLSERLKRGMLKDVFNRDNQA